ncbi:MAG: hypothetical protein JXX28_07160 [Deltaproteobacteria bacterium]|nr:hypothetical protein [Deltaproteobacteria bacterium]
MRVALGSLLALLSLGGCGPYCQSVCTKMAECPELNELRAGYSADEAFGDCLDECENALLTPGVVGDYDPMERNVSGAVIELDNEKQAATWMDCVDGMSCEKLADGYCAPVY